MQLIDQTQVGALGQMCRNPRAVLALQERACGIDDLPPRSGQIGGAPQDIRLHCIKLVKVLGANAPFRIRVAAP